MHFLHFETLEAILCCSKFKCVVVIILNNFSKLKSSKFLFEFSNTFFAFEPLDVVSLICFLRFYEENQSLLNVIFMKTYFLFNCILYGFWYFSKKY